MNAVFVNVDDEGLFIRQGTIHFRPIDEDSIGGLTPRSTTRAWTGMACPSHLLNVATPQGTKLWQKS